MKLVTFKKDAKISCGVLTAKGIVDLTGDFKSVKHIISGGSENLKKIQKIAASCKDFLNPASLQLLAPIPEPGKILALAGNYAKHIVEAGLKLGLTASPRKTTVPRPFLKPNTVVNHPDGIIGWPVYSKEIDYEIELAVVIGKTAKCVSPEEAKDCIAGFTIVNDVSARSVAFKEAREKRPWDEFYDWLGGKWADGFLPMGPCVITADEIDNPQNLQMTLKVNGEIRQNANTADMIFNVYEIVSFLSYMMTLEPADIIATGTPEGVAMATGNFLKAGDKIECTIEKIGTLTNTLGPKPENFYEPLAK
ncbi:MAG: 5-carboxymethyl-2-hydroxymuconate isomerase [Planctomycetes bacterium HGW-Planctomycetes-1]|nr:MAG: 5-carboxymethyl-2-hydroxymuconate isomerase [Planctomycetes bacterium HGW-Planctomycetes-1]